MALARAVVDRLLETNVLASSEQVERAKWGRRIGRVEDERSHHAPRARYAQPIGLRPTGGREGGAELPEGANQRQVDRISRQPVAGEGVARHVLVLENLEAHTNGSR
jgi:hypothetical protein